MKKIKFIFLVLFLFSLLYTNALADFGVGIGTGKIEMNDPLKAGGSYDLPAISVINTGNEEATYTYTITYMQNQKELQPQESWFEFSPKEFVLTPNQTKSVDISLNIPTNAKSGDYFAFVEVGVKDKSVKSGNSKIGVAAATKLNFKVENKGLFYSTYYKISAFLSDFKIPAILVSTLVGLGIIVLIIRKNFEIRPKR